MCIMSLKRYNGSLWGDLGTRKRYTGTEFKELKFGKRYDGHSWVELWSSVGTYTKTYELSDYDTYYLKHSSNAEQKWKGQFAQGCADSDFPNLCYGAMLFFPLEQIAEDLSGSVIDSISIYLERVAQPHGMNNGSLLIHYGSKLTSPPSTWDGTDSGDADAGTPTLGLGQGSWFPLNIAVGEGLRDGRVTFLSMNASNRTGIYYYILFNASKTKLKITYTK